MYADEQNEWFVEGMTEYLSVNTLRKNNLIGDKDLFKKLESFHTRYLFAQNFTSRDVSLKAAGDDKWKNVFLVYGGGCLVAFELDFAIRNATKNSKGLADFFYNLYLSYGITNKRYTLENIKALLAQLYGSSTSKIIENYIENMKSINTENTLHLCGLGMSSFAEEHYLYFLNNSKKHNALFAALFLKKQG